MTKKIESDFRWMAFMGPFPQEEQRHRIVIFYCDDCICKFFTITSQTEKAQRRSKYDPDSLVNISPEEWPKVIIKNSHIECRSGNILEITYTRLQSLIRDKKVERLGTVPEKIKRKIINGICYSKTYSDKQKALFTNG